MLACGQGVAPTRCTGAGVVHAQVQVQVGVQRTRDVGLGELGPAGLGLGQIETAVEHQQGLALGWQLLELCGGNEGGVHGC